MKIGPPTTAMVQRIISALTREAGDFEVHELFQKGVIDESDTPWASNVKKKDGIHASGNISIFSSIDLRCRYRLIPLKAEDRSKMAFITSFGIYQWYVMPFRQRNAGATFSRLADRIRAILVILRLLGYIDDYTLLSVSFLEYLAELHMLFQTLLSRLSPSYAPGDLVMMKYHTLSNASKGVSAKLASRWDGSYSIAQKVGPCSYSITRNSEVLGTYNASGDSLSWLGAAEEGIRFKEVSSQPCSGEPPRRGPGRQIFFRTLHATHYF